MNDVPESPESGELFRHSDGGVYRFATRARHAEGGTQMMVHHDAWPFEPDTWVRAAGVWPTRFAPPMSRSELVEVVAGDRAGAQAAVTQAKPRRPDVRDTEALPVSLGAQTKMPTPHMIRGNPVARKLLVAVFAPALLAMHTMASAIEEPKFAVTQQMPGGVEVREYAPYLVAEVVVPGPAGDAGNKGFKILAAYIFGKNKGERKISMTAPVKQAAAAQKIEMAAPVKQTAVDGGYVVQFVMPAEFSLDTLPEPIDPAVHLKAVPVERFAVIRYSGFWSEYNYEKHLDTLRSTLNAASLRFTGEPVYSRYDPPWTPWFMRRNEIWLKLI